MHFSVVYPQKFENVVRGWLKDGLHDLSLSRQRERLHWGLPVPGDSSQTVSLLFAHSVPLYERKVPKILRIVDIHGAKNTKNQKPWYVLLDYFTVLHAYYLAMVYTASSVHV